MAQVFLVGGAVRDMLMGKKPKDLDFVVVDSSPEEMIALGFSQVGNDFPVFLHPLTGDEFALARTERKTGEGHTGFDCEWEGVTLEEDLSRRDLTINAMAVFLSSSLKACSDIYDWFWLVDCAQLKGDSLSEVLIDPFGGKQDIEDKLLCNVSEHFAEDPLRVLRLGRFLARFGEGWSVDLRTVTDCIDLVDNGDLDDLTPERVWKETSRALMEDTPSLFFNFLHNIEWDGIKELSDLKVVEQRPDHHPEGDAFVHTLECIDAAAKMGGSLPVRFATLMHDLGKRPAFDADRGHLGGHEQDGLPLVEAVCDRWKVTNDCRKLAMLVTQDHTLVHNLHNLNAKTIAKMFERWGLLRDTTIWIRILACCTADGRGRTEKHANDGHPNELLLGSLQEAWLMKVDVEELNSKRRTPVKGKALGDAIRNVRLSRLKEVIHQNK